MKHKTPQQVSLYLKNVKRHLSVIDKFHDQIEDLRDKFQDELYKLETLVQNLDNADGEIDEGIKSIKTGLGYIGDVLR